MPPRIQLRSNVLQQLVPRTASRAESSLVRSSISKIPRIQQVQFRPSHQCRCFSSNPILLKKKTRADREEAAESKPTEVDDSHDFSQLNSGIEKALEKLKNDLSKLRTGGRFNPEVLENLRVHLEKDIKHSERLGDLAQVLPKGGRSLMILVGEKDHIKQIVSAIQGSKDLNLQPQVDAHNGSQLNVPIPPPTKESRDAALAAANKVGETATTGVRNARAAMQKKLRAMEIKKTARPDDLKKASKEMEKITEKGIADVKKAIDAARKTMEQT